MSHLALGVIVLTAWACHFDTKYSFSEYFIRGCDLYATRRFESDCFGDCYATRSLGKWLFDVVGHPVLSVIVMPHAVWLLRWLTKHWDLCFAVVGWLVFSVNTEQTGGNIPLRFKHLESLPKDSGRWKRRRLSPFCFKKKILFDHYAPLQLLQA